MLEFHELDCVLFLLRFIPQLEKIHFSLNVSLNSHYKRKTDLDVQWLLITSKNTFSWLFFSTIIYPLWSRKHFCTKKLTFIFAQNAWHNENKGRSLESDIKKSCFEAHFPTYLANYASFFSKTKTTSTSMWHLFTGSSLGIKDLVNIFLEEFIFYNEMILCVILTTKLWRHIHASFSL